MQASERPARRGNGTVSLMRRRLLLGIAFALALAIFAVDYFSAFDGAVAVLHIAVILLLAPLGRRYVIGAGLATATLTLIAFLSGHAADPTDGSMTRFGVSIVAITITTLLSLRDRFAQSALREQARILELSHDTVIVRDRGDVIRYWNDGAEQLYGWTRAEALGKSCAELLQCSYPAAEVDQALRTGGQWSGEVMRTRRDGTRLVLASRWLLRRAADGEAMGVIESSADLTERRRIAAEREASEQRFRTIFETAGFAAWESDWSQTMRVAIDAAPDEAPLEPWLAARPDLVLDAVRAAVIRNANQAAVDLFEADARDRLVGGNLCGRYLPEGMPAFAHIIAALARGARAVESESRLRTLDDRIIDVIMRVTVLPGAEDWSQVLVMAFDVTERNEARARLEATSAELAHAARVSMLGQLAASIAHEVNQPLTAILNYGKSAQRWLGRPEPDLAELDGCLERIISNSTRAADVIGRVRGLARKTAPQRDRLDLNELIDDAAALVQREARAAKVAIHWPGTAAAPAAGDRVQVQQVLVNLLMNGIQAMRDTADGARELAIAVESLAEGAVRVAVRDRGTGFAGDGAARIFEPFFTTKADGMGMGLSICRSIIETQGGRISAANNTDGPGATVAFTLPLADAPAERQSEPLS